MADRFAATTGMIFGGLLIWAADFVVTYGLAAIACARGLAGWPLPWILTGIHVLAVIGIVMLLRRAVTRDHGTGNAALVRFLCVTLSTLALLAILWGALPPLLQTQRSACS